MRFRNSSDQAPRLIDRSLIQSIVESFGDSVKPTADYSKIAKAIDKKTKSKSRTSEYLQEPKASAPRFKQVATRYTGMSQDQVSLVLKHNSIRKMNTGIKVNTPVLKQKQLERYKNSTIQNSR